jgi:hypothetical protein
MSLAICVRALRYPRQSSGAFVKPFSGLMALFRHSEGKSDDEAGGEDQRDPESA